MGVRTKGKDANTARQRCKHSNAKSNAKSKAKERERRIVDEDKTHVT